MLDGERGKRRLRAKLLARLIAGKIKLFVNYLVIEIMKDLELNWGSLSYMQSWRAREYVLLLVIRKSVDQYKLLSWTCIAIVRTNLDSRAFMGLDGCRFRCMFMAFGASFYEFILGY